MVENLPQTPVEILQVQPQSLDKQNHRQFLKSIKNNNQQTHLQQLLPHQILTKPHQIKLPLHLHQPKTQLKLHLRPHILTQFQRSLLTVRSQRQFLQVDSLRLKYQLYLPLQYTVAQQHSISILIT